jgi:hypothetical protein
MYTKPLTTQPFSRMGRLLKGYGMTAARLAEILNVSTPTARQRLAEPERLTLGDLDRINRKGHVPLEELREAIGR